MAPSRCGNTFTALSCGAAAFVRDAPAVPEVVVDTNPLIRQIVGARRHITTDLLPEYRVEVDPTQFVRLAESGIIGKHPEPRDGAAVVDEFEDYQEFAPEPSQGDGPPASQGGAPQSSQGGSQKAGPKKPPPDPYSTMRLWLPASIMRQVHPSLVEEFEYGARPEQLVYVDRIHDWEPDELERYWSVAETDD